jgi:hypothetical protein
MAGDALAIDIRASLLKIHPDISISTEGENSHILRMRQIEPHCFSG